MHAYQHQAEGMIMKEKRIRQAIEKKINHILHTIHAYDTLGKNADGDIIDADDVLAEIVDIILKQDLGGQR